MSENKLYVIEGCPNCQAVMITLSLSNMDFEVVFTDKKTRFSKDYREMNPLGTVPVLKTKDTSAAGLLPIMKFIGRKNEKVYGGDALQKS